MQCHRCPKNGKPDESCLTCKGADYLDNDHRCVTPMADIAAVSSHALPTAHGEPISAVPRRVADDCANVLEELRKCHHASFPHLLRMFLVFASLGAGAGMLTTVLNGQPMAEYARQNGISSQAADQAWKRAVKANPVLANVRRKRKVKKSR